MVIGDRNQRGQIDLLGHFQKNDCHGNGLIIKGGVRKGKTYLLSILTKILLRNNFAIVSNVRFQNEVYDNFDNLYYITTDKEYFEAYIKIADTLPIVLVWDDIQAQEGFKSTDHKQFTTLSNFLIFLGKYNSNYIYVAHQKYIPDCILDGYEPLFIYKNVRSHFRICESFHEKSSWHCGNCVNVPVPKNFEPLPIMTRGFARFKFVMDLEGLYDYLSEFHVGEQIIKGTKDFMKKGNAEKNEFDELSKLSYEKIYIALCMKKGEILSDGLRLRDMINSNLLTQARNKLRKIGYK